MIEEKSHMAQRRGPEVTAPTQTRQQVYIYIYAYTHEENKYTHTVELTAIINCSVRLFLPFYIVLFLIVNNEQSSVKIITDLQSNFIGTLQFYDIAIVQLQQFVNETKWEYGFYLFPSNRILLKPWKCSLLMNQTG